MHVAVAIILMTEQIGFGQVNGKVVVVQCFRLFQALLSQTMRAGEDFLDSQNF